MRRREFLALAGWGAVFPNIALGQQSGKVPRVAYLFATTTTTIVHDAFVQGLAEHGYVDGKNITIDYYIAPNDAAVPEFAARAVASKPDVIFACSSPENIALKALGTTIPVVFAIIADPVAIGIVQSYVHPGGNMTGTMQLTLDLVGKQFQILREIIPSLKRVAFFGQPDDPPYGLTLSQAMAAAKALDITLDVIEIKEGGEFIGPFDRAVKGGAEAAYFMRVTYFNNNAAVMATLALERKLPSIGGAPVQAEMDGLISFGSDQARVVKDAVGYLDAVLKGAKPADMPVGQPTVFDLVVNLKTARALGLTMPPSLLAQATEVIQ